MRWVVMAGLGAEEYPPPLPFQPPLAQRTNLIRSLTLLESSTAELPNTVRVLFYGQSITEQGWWKRVAEFLRTHYPHARLITENRAIGGHSSQLLVKTAEADLYPFQPDLLIFHVYGAHDRYEDLIRRVRERTTADILLQTDHVTRPEMLTEETNPARLSPKNWDAWMNYSFLPGVAAKYGACRADIHDLWKRHLRDTQLGPADFLKDGVHLNARGEFLMAELLQPYLVPLPPETGRGFDAFECNQVKTLHLPAQGGIGRGSFSGTRLDIQPLSGRELQVRIDGQPPSRLPGTIGFTRASAFPQSNWPILLQVGSAAPLVPETWTLTLDEVLDEGRQAKFHLHGSVTGDEGVGVSTNRFVSISRRVVLEPGDWNLAYCYQVFKRSLAVGHPVTWVADFRGADLIGASTAAGSAGDGFVTAAQGLSNGLHTVEIMGAGTAATSLRVYRPPLVAQ